MNLSPPDIKSDFKIKPFDINEINMSNGLNCYTINNLNTEIIKFNLVFKAGTKYGNAAAITLFSKVVFDGSINYKGNLFSENIDRKGAYVFCKPNADYLIFTLVCQKKDFKELLPVFLDGVFHPELSENNINSTKKREQNSLAEALQYNSVIAEHIFIPAVFGTNSPYGKVLRPEHFNDLTQKDLIAFHHAYIDINNCYALISGEIDELLKGSLGPLDEIISKGFTVSKVELGGFDYSPINQLIENPYSSQSYILMGSKTITKNHPDYIDLKIVTTLLGGYIGSRLMQNIREKSGYTYDISASVAGSEQVGLFRIDSEIQKGKEKEVLLEIENEINRIRNEAISEKELLRLKNYMMGELMSIFDGMFAREGAFLSVHNFGLDLSFYNRFQNSIKELNESTIMDIANRYLNFELFSKITVVPK
mgnify:CR=1 FL=1